MFSYSQEMARKDPKTNERKEKYCNKLFKIHQKHRN